MKKKLLMTLFTALVLSTKAQPLSFSRSDLVANQTRSIARMISVVQPELKDYTKNRIAKSLCMTAKKYKLDPKLMIAIIGTESDFVNGKISTSGDISLAQINTSIWNKEFSRLGLNKINPMLLKKDEAYALNKMAEILNILKARHARKDSKWFARYHSQTKAFKMLYGIKVEKRLKMIASIY